MKFRTVMLDSGVAIPPLVTQQDFQELVESRGFKVGRKENERGRPDYIHGLGASGAFPTDEAQ